MYKRQISEGKIFESDILIEDFFISKISKSISPNFPNTKIIDAEGNFVIPGLIDDQVHFREPGLTHKGNIFSESRSAVAGGITSFFEMPNTQPNTTTINALNNKYNIASENSIANYSFMFGGTNSNLDELFLKTHLFFHNHYDLNQNQSHQHHLILTLLT